MKVSTAVGDTVKRQTLTNYFPDKTFILRGG